MQTTTGLAPEEIHEIGLAEVERIRREMRAVAGEVGFEGDLADSFAHLRATDSLYFEAPEDLLQAYEALRGTVESHLERLFARPAAGPGRAPSTP